MNFRRAAIWFDLLLFGAAAFVAVLVPVRALCVAVDAPKAPTEALVIETLHYARSGIAYEVLTQQSLTQGKGVRKDQWHSDANLAKEARANNSDYAICSDEFDKGHLAPAADQSYQAAIDATFSYANCAPQYSGLNRGLWEHIEQQVRASVNSETTCYVVTAPLFLPDDKGIITIQTRGQHKLWTPTHFCKAVLQVRRGKSSMIAWIVPNVPPQEGATVDDYRVTVDEIEFATGHDLFAWLDEETQKKLEATKGD